MHGEQDLLAEVYPLRHTDVGLAAIVAGCQGDMDLELLLATNANRMIQIWRIQEVVDMTTQLGCPKDGREHTECRSWAWMLANAQSNAARHPLLNEFYRLWQSRLMVD